jgi:hypothetical protein
MRFVRAFEEAVGLNQHTESVLNWIVCFTFGGPENWDHSSVGIVNFYCDF